MSMPIISSIFPAISALASVSDPILRSCINFELITPQGERNGYSFNFLKADICFSQHHLLKILSFLHHMFLARMSKIKLAGKEDGG
jgi:hypothetical protein